MRTTYTTDTISFSSSTRIRTWNLSLEARHDVRFTIEPFHSINFKRKAWDLNPHDPVGVARFSKPARRAVSGYLPYVFSGPTGNRTHPCPQRIGQPAELVSPRLTMSPSVERRGIEPRLPGCKPSVFPLDQRPISQYSFLLSPCARLPSWQACSVEGPSGN